MPWLRCCHLYLLTQYVSPSCSFFTLTALFILLPSKCTVVTSTAWAICSLLWMSNQPMRLCRPSWLGQRFVTHLCVFVKISLIMFSFYSNFFCCFLALYCTYSLCYLVVQTRSKPTHYSLYYWWWDDVQPLHESERAQRTAPCWYHWPHRYHGFPSRREKHIPPENVTLRFTV